MIKSIFVSALSVLAAALLLSCATAVAQTQSAPAMNLIARRAQFAPELQQLYGKLRLGMSRLHAAAFSRTFLRIDLLTNQTFIALMNRPEVYILLSSEKLHQALENPNVQQIVHSKAFQRFLSSQEFQYFYSHFHAPQKDGALALYFPILTAVVVIAILFIVGIITWIPGAIFTIIYIFPKIFISLVLEWLQIIVTPFGLIVIFPTIVIPYCFIEALIITLLIIIFWPIIFVIYMLANGGGATEDWTVMDE